MSKTFKFSDTVCMRMVQIFQEAMIFGIDGADLLRQVELLEREDGSLDLTPEYKSLVAKMHQQYLEDAERLKKEQDEHLMKDVKSPLILVD